MTLFYHPDFLSSTQLPEEEAQHAVRVLRLTKGDKIGLLDGKGNVAEAIIESTDKRSCNYRIQHHSVESPIQPAFHLLLAPTKNIDRIEWLVEKTTELGIASISFFQSEHSERKQINMDRLEKIAVSALKQSKGAWLPTLHPMLKFKDVITSPSITGNKIIAHQETGKSVPFLNSLKKDIDTWVLIGPEGDFSLEEVQYAQENGFQSVTLGCLRLRTETAALAACSSFHLWRG